ncbi:MAG: S41 family peptidase [Bacteroidota bacterium]
MKKYYVIVLLAVTFSCKEVFFETEPSNDPETNFELFWTDFNERYSLFGVRGWDWDSIYAVYRPQVNPNTTNQELWVMCKAMIAYLDDSHTFIFSRDEKYMIDGEEEYFFASGSETHDQTEREFSIDLIRDAYLEDLRDLSFDTDIYLSGKISGENIGYIYFDAVDVEDDRYMDLLLEGLEDSDALIIDIRQNGGGNDIVAAEFASRFSDNTSLTFTVEEKAGPGPNDFSPKIPFHAPPPRGRHYTKPIVVLTDNFTVSGAEIFLWYMKSYDHVTQIGTSTSGDFSDTSMRRFLPNGWQYQYSIMKYLSPDGQSLDGLGHRPDIEIRNSEADIAAGKDVVLERAMQYLEEELGI